MRIPEIWHWLSSEFEKASLMIPNSAVKSLETQRNDSPFSPADFLKYRYMSFWDPGTDCQQFHPVSSLGFSKGLLVKAAALVIVNLQPLEKYFLFKKKKKVEELF